MNAEQLIENAQLQLETLDTHLVSLQSLFDKTQQKFTQQHTTLNTIVAEALDSKNAIEEWHAKYGSFADNVSKISKNLLSNHFYSHNFTTAQSVYDFINNAPEIAILKIRYSGKEPLKASKINVKRKEIYLNMGAKNSEFIFDRTIQLEGGYFALCTMWWHPHYFTVRTNILFHGRGAVYLGGYYGATYRTDLTHFIFYKAAWHSDNAVNVGSVELFSVRLKLTREDGSGFDTHTPLRVTYTRAGDHFGMGFNRHKMFGLHLNGATATQNNIVGA